MKKIMKYLVIGLFILSIPFIKTQGQTKLPEKRPLDFALHSKYDGGMSYHFSELYISKDSCVLVENKQGKKTNKHFKLSTKQLDAIYTSLLQNKFDQIISDSSPTIVNDRGGTTIMITWDKGQKMIGVSDAYSSFVTKEWETNWNTFQEELRLLLKNKLK